MSVRKYIRIAGFAVMLAVAIPAGAGILAPVSTHEVAKENPRVQQLTERLEEIRNMNVSALSGDEKQTLRREVKSIKREMRAMKGGVYLSVGAVIIVALILVLFL